MTRTRRLALAAAALAALVALGGCGSASGSSSTSSLGSTSGPPSTSTAAGTVTVLKVTVKGRQVTPALAEHQLAVGHTLRLIVTSDHDDQLHAHGFDKEVPLKAGQPTTLDLTPQQAGVYEIETHEPPLTLLNIVVH